MKVSIPIEWGTTGACEHDGDNITRLSIGGCFIKTEKEVSSGDAIFLRLWQTSHESGVLRGKVVYLFRLSTRLPPIGLGVEFAELDEEDKTHLKHLLEFYNEGFETSFSALSD